MKGRPMLQRKGFLQKNPRLDECVDGLGLETT